MQREFICHRCGAANRRGAENCSYCGLQVGWRPSVPEWLLLWRWPALIRECLGSLAAPLAVTVELAMPGTSASFLLTLPLLTFSATLLVYHAIIEIPDDQVPQEQVPEDGRRQ
jgi:hypothetical protein